jgi:hypothetical protein
MRNKKEVNNSTHTQSGCSIDFTPGRYGSRESLNRSKSPDSSEDTHQVSYAAEIPSSSYNQPFHAMLYQTDNTAKHLIKDLKDKSNPSYIEELENKFEAMNYKIAGKKGADKWVLETEKDILNKERNILLDAQMHFYHQEMDSALQLGLLSKEFQHLQKLRKEVLQPYQEMLQDPKYLNLSAEERQSLWESQQKRYEIEKDLDDAPHMPNEIMQKLSDTLNELACTDLSRTQQENFRNFVQKLQQYHEDCYNNHYKALQRLPGHKILVV